MKFFVDTANITTLKRAASMGLVDGVTTNPSLMKKENIRGTEAVKAHYKAICDLFPGKPVSAEVLSTTAVEMLEEAEVLRAICPEQIVVKLPITQDGLTALHECTKRGYATNVTLVFSVGQALLAAKAGATYVSPFIGRIDDTGHSGLQLIDEIVQCFSLYPELETQILGASIRNSQHITECALLGCDVVTSPLKHIESLLNHPLTDKGLAQFIADSKEMKA